MPQPELQETDAGWTLPLTGMKVTRCCWERSGVRLLLHEGERSSEITFMAGAPRDDLLDAVVTTANVDRVGTLTISFADGRQLKVEPHPRFEAWNVGGPHPLQLICVPGGGEPAIWDGGDSFEVTFEG